jgi:methylated-DNA-[protein]-cysteine S-methyltransferase
MATAQPESPAFDAVLATLFATLGVRIEDDHLVGLEFLPATTSAMSRGHVLVGQLNEQLTEYQRDPAFRFELPLNARGSEFRRRVWQALLEILPGRPITYGELARRLGSSPRAVGQALGDNPLPIVIPCHRVIAADGGLGGFNHSPTGYSIDIKRRLLAHEAGR